MPQHTHVLGGIQRGPRRADNFTILSNEVINDSRLSFRARGVLLYLLSKPADWRTRSEAIAAQSPREGREAIRTAMRELEAYGYLVREKRQDPDTGRFETIQTVYEEPVAVENPQVAPAPRKPVAGRASTGKLGRFTRTESRRTETNNNQAERGPRQCEANVRASLSEKAQEFLAKDDQALADLEAATLAAGLPASFAKIRKGEILALLDVHGVQALVDAAQKAHRPENPTMHVHGWLRLWAALPLPRVTAGPPSPDELKRTCSDCVGGWVEDTDGLPIRRCACRTAPQAAAR